MEEKWDVNGDWEIKNDTCSNFETYETRKVHRE